MSHLPRFAALACLILLLAAAVSLSQAPQPDVVPPDPQAQWYKGNLHTHSLWSDGNDFPEMIVEWYYRHDYDFLALSDHNILSQGDKWIDSQAPARRGGIAAYDRYLSRFGEAWVQSRPGKDDSIQVRLKPLNEYRSLFEERGKFILLQSEEITDHYENLPVHMNVANVRDVVRPQGGESVRDVIARNFAAVQDQIRRTGRPMLVHLNHPNFGYGVTAEDIAAVIEERFFEVYNGHPGVGHLGDEQHASVERLWDIANTIRLGQLHAPPLYGLATDDSHNYFGTRGSSPGRGWVMVRCRHLTPESIIAAMQRGDFYASSGVRLRDINYNEESRELTVVIDPDPGAEYTTQFIGTLEGYDPSSQPVLDEAGNPIRATQRYSDEVGRVLAVAPGTTARYRLTGEELYVRAVVTSSLAPENPSHQDQKQQAWTQPVGWEKRLTEPPVEAPAVTGE